MISSFCCLRMIRNILNKKTMKKFFLTIKFFFILMSAISPILCCIASYKFHQVDPWSTVKDIIFLMIAASIFWWTIIGSYFSWLKAERNTSPEVIETIVFSMSLIVLVTIYIIVNSGEESLQKLWFHSAWVFPLFPLAWVGLHAVYISILRPVWQKIMTFWGRISQKI